MHNIYMFIMFIYFDFFLLLFKYEGNILYCVHTFIDKKQNTLV